MHRSPALFIAVIAAVLLGARPAQASFVQWKISEGGNDHYYGLIFAPTVSGNYTWTVAQAAASSMTYLGSQGYLATVTSAAEDQFLQQTFGSQFAPDYALLGGPRGDSAWIGLTDEVAEGDYRWVTGESFSFSNWGPPEPNNLGNEDYVHYWRRDYDGSGPLWSWNDAGVTPLGFDVARYGFFVEFSPPFAHAVPEPASLCLAGLAGVCGLCYGWAKRGSRRARRAG